MTQDKLEGIVREVLGEDYVSFEVLNYRLDEDVRTHQAHILCSLQRSGEIDIRGVEGSGVGMIDALFKALKGHLAVDYPSLDHIHFVEFSISGDFTSEGADGSRSDAIGHVQLVVENTSGRQFAFNTSSCSVSGSSVRVVVKAVEHFVNAERAVLRVYEWIDDAKRRGRPELAERYVQRLADLVKNASYSEAIERKKSSVGV